VALTTPKYTTIKNAYLLAAIGEAARKEYSSENVEFYHDKSSNQVLYEKYIKENAPKQVNLAAQHRQPLDELAAQKKWSSMSTGLKAARVQIAALIDKDTMMRFANSAEGKFVIGIAAMGLDGAKAKQARSLLTVYVKPRSPQDKYQAYLALAKLSSQAKVDPVLAALGLPAPGKPVSDEAIVAKNVKVDTIAKKLRVDIADGLKYYASALKYLKAKGLPADPLEVRRMFDSGRMRHDRVHLPYTDAIRQDKDFAAKYKDVMAEKMKLEAAWAAYRTALEKK
jgi:hypothetical protein